MRRFYRDVTVAAVPDGYAILLDGRPVRTPQRATLAAPSEALASAISEEWAAQGEEIRIGTMKLTALANAAIDVIGPDPDQARTMLGAYAETDALAYRGDEPALLARQAAIWNPLLDWAEQRWNVQFNLASGIMHVAQPAATISALRDALAALNAWELAALSPLTTLGGSLVVAIAVVSGSLDPDLGWAAVTLEEAFQEERWGVDAEALAARQARQAEWAAAARLASLLRA